MKEILIILLVILNYELYAQIIKPEKGHYVREVIMDLDTLFFDSLPVLIEPDGTVLLISDSDTATIDLSTEVYVDRAHLHQSDSILFIFYGETDMLSGTSYLEAYDLERLTLLYKTPIPGFNLGQPVIRDQMAYVSSLGFVGKIDLMSGDYLWKFDELYDRNSYDFNDFDAAEFEDGLISFRSHNRIKNSTRTIIINDLTGKRME